MASINFVYGTIIPSTWLNAVNTAVYTTLPTLAPIIGPNFTTPSLGVATAISINKNTFTQPTTNATWTLADGKTLTVSNTMTLAGTDGSTLNIGTGGTLASGAFAVASSGTNTGDQLVFKTISVSGQSDVVADTITDTLTLVAGTNISITTNAATDAITINSTVTQPALILLATVTPTAAATIDFLSTFTSTYDNYLILVDGVYPSVDDRLKIQLGKTGAVNSGAVYITGAMPMASSATSGYGSLQSSATFAGTQAGCYEIRVLNANLTNYKTILSTALWQSPTTSDSAHYSTMYTDTAVVTGFRLSWLGAANFAAAGRVRVYGYQN